MFQPKRKRKTRNKKEPLLDLTNAPVKRRSTQVTLRGLAARSGELRQIRGADPELQDPPVYRVERRGKANEPSAGTEY